MSFKDRLIEEKQQLDEKIAKLESFMSNELFAGIGDKQQSLLHVQLPVMKAYSQILLERIVDLQKPEGSSITISAEEYKALKKSDAWLGCLEQNGVDNWEGHDIASDQFEKEFPEYQD